MKISSFGQAHIEVFGEQGSDTMAEVIVRAGPWRHADMEPLQNARREQEELHFSQLFSETAPAT